jgi:hypothetical protein
MWHSLHPCAINSHPAFVSVTYFETDLKRANTQQCSEVDYTKASYLQQR